MNKTVISTKILMMSLLKIITKIGPKLLVTWVAIAFCIGLVTYGFKISGVALFLTLAFLGFGYLFVSFVPIFVSGVRRLNGENESFFWFLVTKIFCLFFLFGGAFGFLALLIYSVNQTGTGFDSTQFVLSIAVYPLGVSVGAARLLSTDLSSFENGL